MLSSGLFLDEMKVQKLMRPFSSLRHSQLIEETPRCASTQQPRQQRHEIYQELRRSSVNEYQKYKLDQEQEQLFIKR